MSAVNGVAGSVIFTLDGAEIDSLYGRGVCGVGDFDGDGVGDLAVGAAKDDAGFPNGGRYFVYAGAVTDECRLNLVGPRSAGSSVVIRHMSTPAIDALVLVDTSSGPVAIPPFGLFALGFTPALMPLADSAGLYGATMGPPVDSQGLLDLGPFGIPPGLVGITLHFQSFAITAGAPNGYFQKSNGLSLTFLP